ncbi:inorganic diphosphatase [Mycoplasmoides gallisepticum]|uniref:inorganic diphosphatase n=1 Tax=Mycoplasmoides gallisepticum TaxID=2096 RepID=UPI003305A8C0
MSNLLELKVTIEIPKGSNIKYEYDRKTGQISVDRILYGSEVYPHNYGFIKEALDWDGDELDCLVVANQAFQPGVVVPVRILGMMGMVDSGETDNKLIGVIACDKRFENIRSLKDLGAHALKEIKGFFETYKLLQNKKVLVKGFKELDSAIHEYKNCVSLMNRYGSLPKDEFIAKMKKMYPEKYME